MAMRMKSITEYYKLHEEFEIPDGVAATTQFAKDLGGAVCVELHMIVPVGWFRPKSAKNADVEDPIEGIPIDEGPKRLRH